MQPELIGLQGANKHLWIDAVMASTSLSQGAKLRAWALWKFADKAGFCWPNQSDIEAAIGNRSTARTSAFMAELRRAGWVVAKYQSRGGVRKSANYTLCWPNASASAYPAAVIATAAESRPWTTKRASAGTVARL